MTARYLIGDVFDRLAELEDGSIDLVVTSPPFLALRSYLPADHPDKGKEIGSEPTPAAFLDVMLAVTAELRRVLAPHGSIAIELGDTYAGSTMSGGDDRGNERYPEGRSQSQVNGLPNRKSEGPGWPLAKSKTLIPELFRIALAYGFNPLTGTESPAGKWRVRNVVTWCRPNPPVGALGDKWRPATSDVVVACVSGKRYWDDLATRKEISEWTKGYADRYPISDRALQPDAQQSMGRNAARTAGEGLTQQGAPLLDYWEIPLLGDEEPKPYGSKEPTPKGHQRISKNAEPRTDLPSRNNRGGNWASLPERNDDPNGPGAPLLDYWEIPPTGYSGSHYAVFPPALVVPLVKAMCPARVCVECGEPSRRIVKSENHSEERLALAAHMKAQRETKGLTVKELAAHFPSASGGVTGCVWNWENAANVPTAEQWPKLVDMLELSDEFDHLIEGERSWTESLVEYEHVSDHPSGWTQNADGGVYQRLSARKNRIEPEPEWSDCGHDNWRRGIVLDPFAGSGTTLMVAHGHDRDTLGIDLDERNAELARERVGPMFLETHG